MDCALTLAARGRPMKTVSEVLGVARSNLQIRARRSVEWTDGRCHRQPRADAALSLRSRPRSRRCLPTAIGGRGRWSIGAGTATGERGSTTSVSTASCATIICCCAGTPVDPSIGVATTDVSQSARAIGAGARTVSRSLATIGSGYGLRRGEVGHRGNLLDARRASAPVPRKMGPGTPSRQ